VCEVWIYDALNQPVEGAVVSADATGPVGGSFSGTTGADGKARMETGKTRNPVGEWCFEVTGVTHATHTYDPGANVVTLACESGPVRDHAAAAGLFFGLGREGIVTSAGMRTITFSLAEGSYVELEVFNVAGQRVATLVDGWRQAGGHTAQFDASVLPSGVYFYRLQAGTLEESRKILLVR
jgi:hypothetical protein